MKRLRFGLHFLFLFVYLAAAQDFGVDENKQSRGYERLFEKKSAEQVREAQTHVDARYYHLDLDLRYDPNILYGRVTARFSSRINNLNLLALDLDEALQVDSIAGPVSGFTHTGQALDITLEKSFNQNAKLEVVVYYHGLPASGDFQYDKMDVTLPHIWTLSEPFGAKYWWPCKDTPADKADSVDITLTVPSGQLAASNGLLRDQTDNGDGTTTFYWHEKHPITTYLVSLAIGPYTHQQDVFHDVSGTDMLLDFYVYPSRADVIPYLISETRLQLKTLSELYGPYPFLDEKYGLAQFGWGGGMEHQTLTSVGPISNNARYLYVHELGHQWFGDALTCASWSDIWLNEGFATYTEALYAEKIGFNGNDPGLSALHSYMSTKLFFADGTITVHDTSQVANIFARIVYDKAGWVLHMLRHVLGETNFFRVLRVYATGSLRYTSVRTADFKNICEQISGKNLDVFFEQWLDEPFYPQYAFGWDIIKTANPPDDKIAIDIKIEQRQSGIVYEMPVDFTFSFPSSPDTTIVLNNTLRQQTFRVFLDQRPSQVVLDHNSWILKEVQQLSKGTYHADVVLENPYPNPMSDQTTIYVSSWDLQEVVLTIFDVNGRLVRRLNAGHISNGHDYVFQWDRRNGFGNRVAAGIYFIGAVRGAVLSKNVKRVIVLN